MSTILKFNVFFQSENIDLLKLMNSQLFDELYELDMYLYLAYLILFNLADFHR